MQELQATLEHTPIPHEDVIAKGHRTVWYTWFETFHKHSTLSCLFEVRHCARLRLNHTSRIVLNHMVTTCYSVHGLTWEEHCACSCETGPTRG